MKIRIATLNEWQKWPITSSRFLIPTVCIKGFKGEPMLVIFAFWKWRFDLRLLPNNALCVKEDGR